MDSAIFLMGPTAAGKTELALRLADQLPCDIISVDSALIYRGMDIGTAKPAADVLQRYPHHLVDIRDPAQSYSAAEFRSDALALMAQSCAAGRIPLLVGGTMMYYNALVKGLAPLPEADPQIRASLLAQAEAEGWPALHRRLAEVDPESAARLAPNDSQRLQRAMEVYLLTGQTIGQLWAQQDATAFPYRVINLAVMPDSRALLHERIAIRFQQMLQLGLVDEVAHLHQRGDLHPGLPAIRCVGYRQVWEYLDGMYDFTRMTDKGIVATRQLAKRQITWLRSWPDLHWLDSSQQDIVTRSLKLIEAAII